MAMLASRQPFPAPLGSSSSAIANYRIQTRENNNHFFASPTESEFSERYDAPESVQLWDEDRVAEWLRSIGCGQYIDLFKRAWPSLSLLEYTSRYPQSTGLLTPRIGNNINGDSIMELEQAQLKDMGVKKIGDRIRISTQSKQLRNKEYRRSSKSRTNRVCCIAKHHIYCDGVLTTDYRNR